MSKTKLIKPLLVFEEGEVADYQSIIEERIGSWLATLAFYDANWDCKKVIKGVEVDRDRAYFTPDCDYELVIRKKRIKK